MKENMKRGEAKKRQKINKGKQTNDNKNSLVRGGGGQGFSINNKEKKKQRKTKGFRAMWGGPLGHLTWPLNPQKTKT